MTFSTLPPLATAVGLALAQDATTPSVVVEESTPLRRLTVEELQAQTETLRGELAKLGEAGGEAADALTRLAAITSGLKRLKQMTIEQSGRERADTYDLALAFKPTDLVIALDFLSATPPVLCVYRGRKHGALQRFAFNI